MEIGQEVEEEINKTWEENEKNWRQEQEAMRSGNQEEDDDENDPEIEEIGVGIRGPSPYIGQCVSLTIM